MLLITEKEVRGVLTLHDAADCIERALADRARGRAFDVPRERTRTILGTLNILQGAAPQVGVVGYKAYYATPQGTRSHVYLYDAVSGLPLALMEADFFNVVRTGAATAAATRLLARPDVTVLGQIGAGRIGAGQLEAVCAVRPIRHAIVYSRTRDKLETFCREMSDRLGIVVTPADSAEEAVSGVDILNVITKSATPVLAGAWLAPGQHVNAAGANQLSRRELDTETVQRCDLITVDSRDTARRECGDFLPLVESGSLQWESLTEIGDIMAGLQAGRVSNEQITLYKSHGMAVQDLYVAARVLELVRAR